MYTGNALLFHKTPSSRPEEKLYTSKKYVSILPAVLFPEVENLFFSLQTMGIFFQSVLYLQQLKQGKKSSRQYPKKNLLKSLPQATTETTTSIKPQEKIY